MQLVLFHDSLIFVIRNSSYQKSNHFTEFINHNHKIQGNTFLSWPAPGESNNLKTFQVCQDLFTFLFLYIEHLDHMGLEKLVENSLHSCLKRQKDLLTGGVIQLE